VPIAARHEDHIAMGYETIPAAFPPPVEKIGCRREVHTAPGRTCSEGEGDRQVGLAHAGPTDEVNTG
jgi:hypothetical protein